MAVVAPPARRRPAKRPWWGTFLLGVWLPITVILTIWFTSADSQQFFFPSFSRILQRTWDLWFGQGLLLSDLLPSFLRILIGLAIALVLGVGLGIVFGLLRPVEQALRPLTDAARAVPGAALLPIAMMFLGPGEPMKIALIAFTAMWPIFLNTIEGVRSVEPLLHSVMDSFHIRRGLRFTSLYLPATMPQVFAGARVSLGIAVSVMVIVEMFGTPGGVGYLISFYKNQQLIVNMWTALIILGVFGYLLNLLFRIFENRVLGWHRRMVEHAQGGN